MIRFRVGRTVHARCGTVPGVTPAGDESERRLSVLAHAAALMGLLLPTGQLLGPYLVFLLSPSDATGVRRHAIEALNFQLNMLAIVTVLLALLLWARAGWGFFALFIPPAERLGSSAGT